MLRNELPQLFEVTKGPYRYDSIPLRRFYCNVHDCVFYFYDTTMYDDIMAVKESPDCEFRKYEMTRLSGLKNVLNEALQRWDEDKIDIPLEDVAYGNELKDAVNNLEVKYRDAEMARILNSDRVNRNHRARNDSGQNEAERSNACIGEALVDGGSMKWKFYDALEGLTKDEKEALSLEDIKNLEELAMERNARKVAKEVAKRINHEPGPAGDFMHPFLTPQGSSLFFFNTQQLRQFVWPGGTMFLEQHILRK